MNSKFNTKEIDFEQENSRLLKENALLKKRLSIKDASSISKELDIFESFKRTVDDFSIGTIFLDYEFKIIYTNIKINEIFNAISEEFAGKYLFQYDKIKMFSILKESKIGTEVYFEGTFKPIKQSEEAYVSIQAKKIQLANNKFAIALAIQDITEQHLAENAVFKSYDTFQKVTDNLNYPIFVIDLENFNLLFLNRIAIKLQNKLNINNINKDILQNLCKLENISNIEYGEIRETKYFEPINEQWFHITCNLIEWIDSKKVVLISAIDITDKQKNDLLILEQNKKLEDALLKSTKQNERINNQAKLLQTINVTKDTMFSIIGHDLRGPVGNVKNALDILIEEYDDLSSNEIYNFIDALRESADSVFNLLANLLFWAKSQSGKIEYRPENILLNDIIEENIMLFTSSLSKKNINLHYAPKDEYFLLADENMIDAIVRNVLSNAIKFTFENGNININIEECIFKGQNAIKFSIIDDGIGIKKADISKVLDSKEHFSTYGTSNEKGSGLGLILCNEFITKHEGEMLMESVKYKGTTFTFTLPVNSQ